VRSFHQIILATGAVLADPPSMGIPVGSDLEFADEVTMLKSLENRREM